MYETNRVAEKDALPGSSAPVRGASALVWMVPVLVAGVLPPRAAHAITIDANNPDLVVRWDNSIRYNLGVRAEKRDARVDNNPANGFAGGLGNQQFNRGDIMLNRFDLLSEFDAVYKEKVGVRLSAAGWYDPSTYSRDLNNPTATCSFFYANCKYSNYTKRYVSGPSGELLDAFVFGTLDLGEVRTSARVGRHTVFWGSGLYGTAIATGQSPINGMKAQMSPGIQLKELYMPLSQISVSSQLTPEISIGALRTFRWEHSRQPESGTYFDAFSAGYYGPDGSVTSRQPVNEPSKNGGDWGLMTKWTPQTESLPSVGLYYREFYEKSPLASYAIPAPTTSPIFVAFAPAYNPVKNKLIGIALEKNLFGVNWGMEVARRENASLRSAGAAGLGAGKIDPNNPANPYPNGPTGTVYDALLNAVMLLPQSFLSPGGNVSAELSYQRLDKVTFNPTQLTFGAGGAVTGAIPNAGHSAVGSPLCLDPAGAPGGLRDNCASRSAWAFAMSLTPEWPQALPGVDVSATLYLSVGLKGNAPANYAVNEGGYSYSLGTKAVVYNLHTFKLAYNDSRNKINDNGSGGLSGSGSWMYNDRGWLSFSYQYSF